MNELSDGKAHDFRDLPYVIAGSCGGYLKQGQYIRVSGTKTRGDQDAPHNKLLATFMNAVGIPTTRFGDPNYAPAGEIDLIKA